MSEEKRSKIFHQILSFLSKKTVAIFLSIVPVCTTLDLVFKLHHSLSLSISSQLRSEKNAEILQLSSYANFGQLLREYRKIEPDISNSKNEYQKLFESQKNASNICKTLIEKYNSGASIYYSKDFSSYKKVHDFFETLGLLLDKDVIDFNLVFQLFTFPGKFPEGKYAADFPNWNFLISLDECVSSNWFQKNDSLPDFGSYVKQLGYNYAFARLKLTRDIRDPKEREIRSIQMKELKDNQCHPFYPSDPHSPFWIKIYPGQYDWNDINKYYWHKC
jgi:hypothetical protein